MSVIYSVADLLVYTLRRTLKPGEILMVLSIAKSMVEKKPAGVGRQVG
ncbi:MAG: hypothetical protein H6Q72_1422 [Firmicutes bacterium]|nr:hypothetical protein [Bacillota bacterium]